MDGLKQHREQAQYPRYKLLGALTSLLGDSTHHQAARGYSGFHQHFTLADADSEYRLQVEIETVYYEKNLHDALVYQSVSGLGDQEALKPHLQFRHHFFALFHSTSPNPARGGERRICQAALFSVKYYFALFLFCIRNQVYLSTNKTEQLYPSLDLTKEIINQKFPSPGKESLQSSAPDSLHQFHLSVIMHFLECEQAIYHRFSRSTA